MKLLMVLIDIVMYLRWLNFILLVVLYIYPKPKKYKELRFWRRLDLILPFNFTGSSYDVEFLKGIRPHKIIVNSILLCLMLILLISIFNYFYVETEHFTNSVHNSR